MWRGQRNLLVCAGLVSGLAITGGALVRAQQGETPAPAVSSAPAPPGPTEEAPPPTDAALSAAAAVPPSPPTQAADVEPAPPSSSEQTSSARPVEPLKRPRYASAVIQTLDKVTAQTLRFEVPINRPVRYKSLIFVVRACETTASDEAFSDAAAHVEIDSQPLPPDGKAPPPAKQVFLGWMFANAPGLNLFQHPVYDAWLIACKTEAPSA